MSIFGTSFNNDDAMMEGVEFNDAVDALIESYIFDEISKLSDEKRTQFVNSEAAQLLVESRLVGKNTIVRLSKVDDLERRMSMASLQLAKDSEDVLYTKLAQVRVKEREYLSKINKKYGTRATRVARTAQKEFLKKVPIGFHRK